MYRNRYSWLSWFRVSHKSMGGWDVVPLPTCWPTPQSWPLRRPSAGYHEASLSGKGVLGSSFAAALSCFFVSGLGNHVNKTIACLHTKLLLYTGHLIAKKKYHFLLICPHILFPSFPYSFFHGCYFPLGFVSSYLLPASLLLSPKTWEAPWHLLIHSEPLFL